MKKLAYLFAVGLFGFVVVDAHAQGGIPEPGVVVYGRMLSSDGERSIPFSSAMLRFTVGNRSLDVEAEPVQSRGEHYYVAHIPFETRRLSSDENATVIGQDPAKFELRPDGEDEAYSFETTGRAPNFGLPGEPSIVTVGDEASVNLSLAANGTGTFLFGDPSQRGKVVQMDIVTTFPPNGRMTYEQWARSIWGSIEGDGMPNADPDGDGLTNEFEFIAGLDPTNADPDSPLNRFVISIGSLGGDGVAVSFSPRVEGRVYTVRKASDLTSPVTWEALPGDADSSEQPLEGEPDAAVRTVVDRSASDERGFYTVEIVYPE